MERWKGRVALVSGASVGIGAAVVKVLVQHGMKVAGCARSVDKIECISPGLVETEFAYRLFSDNPEKAAATYRNKKCCGLYPEFSSTRSDWRYTDEVCGTGVFLINSRMRSTRELCELQDNKD